MKTNDSQTLTPIVDYIERMSIVARVFKTYNITAEECIDHFDIFVDPDCELDWGVIDEIEEIDE